MNALPVTGGGGNPLPPSPPPGRRRLGLLVLLGPLVAACAVGPDYEKPAVPLRTHYVEAARKDAAKARKPGEWWRGIDDPVLQQLVADTVQRGYDLRIAVARVEEVRALRGAARADFFPRIDAVGSAARVQDSNNSFFGSFFQGGDFDTERSEFRVGLESAWEIDLWGRVRRQVEAADADVAAAHELLADTLRVIVADVASEYVSLRGAERELEVTRRNIATQSETLELTESLAAEGLGSQADVSRARAQLRETESFVPLLEGIVAGGVHRLAVLTGGDAEPLRARLAGTPALPGTPLSPSLGVPSDLLQARPDVRAAERDLAAATARIGVATADLFPRITLLGRVGLEATELKNLFEADSVAFGVGPSVRWPLLDFGRVRAQIGAQGARQHAALARYEQVVARAVAEVEIALASLGSRERNRDALSAALADSREAFRLVNERFRAGASSFLDVLDAQRRVLIVEAALSRAQTQLLLDYVALNRALG